MFIFVRNATTVEMSRYHLRRRHHRSRGRSVSSEWSSLRGRIGRRRQHDVIVLRLAARRGPADHANFSPLQ